MLGFSGLSGFSDGGQILTSLGINVVEAAMTVPYLFASPATTDPDMAAIKIINKGARQGLVKAGYNVSTDAKYQIALAEVAGSDWRSTQWYKILEAVKAAVEKKYATIKLPTVPVGDPPPPFYKDPMILISGAIIAYVLFSGKSRRRR